MKLALKPILFILANLVFIVLLALILLLIKDVYAGTSDLMSVILILPACLTFIVIGVCLFILSKFFPIYLLNKLLPFISVPALIGSTWFTSSKSALMLVGMFIAAALIILAAFTTVTNLRRNRNKKGG